MADIDDAALWRGEAEKLGLEIVRLQDVNKAMHRVALSAVAEAEAERDAARLHLADALEDVEALHLRVTEAWHAGAYDPKLTLREVLGMTQAEYAAWVTDPSKT